LGSGRPGDHAAPGTPAGPPTVQEPPGKRN